jgi:single cache domain-containing protein
MRMTLGRKFQALLAIALGFVVVVGATAIYGVSSLSGRVDQYAKEAVPSLEALSGLATAVGIAVGGAFVVFSDPHGPFTYRDLYMTVYDLEGKCLAHGAKKVRIGKSLVDDRDADGKLFVRERVELARKAPKGWQEYEFVNPATKRIEDKVAYFEVVDGLILLSGAYKP